MNDRLRTVMVRQGVTVDDLAEACRLDPKTVERWISLNRVPHRRHRWTAARRLDTDEAYLWPSVMERGPGRRQEASRAELVNLYHTRAAVPQDLWLRLLDSATAAVDVLVYSGTFFSQVNPRVSRHLAEAAERGAKVRLCFGDPDSEAVAIRDREEKIDGTLGAKIRSSLTYYRDLPDREGCEVRLHGTTLYASLFRYDDQLLINTHVYGEPASVNPVLHVRRVDGGGLFDHYALSFDRVWATAPPWTGKD